MKQHTASIEEIILSALGHGPMPRRALWDEVFAACSCTEQGYYKALRSLKAREIVTIHGKQVSLSYLWIHTRVTEITAILQAYQMPAYQLYFGFLQDGQSVKYKFGTLRELDNFWAHAFLIAADSFYTTGPVLSIIPHDWFELVHPLTNSMWDARLGKRPLCVVLTHATPEERIHAKHRQTKQREQMLGVNPLHQKETVYFVVLGDLIFEAHLDVNTAAAIRHTLRSRQPDVSAGILDTHGSFSLKVHRSKAKALKMKRSVTRYFSHTLI